MIRMNEVFSKCLLFWNQNISISFQVFSVPFLSNVGSFPVPIFLTLYFVCCLALKALWASSLHIHCAALFVWMNKNVDAILLFKLKHLHKDSLKHMYIGTRNALNSFAPWHYYYFTSLLLLTFFFFSLLVGLPSQPSLQWLLFSFSYFSSFFFVHCPLHSRMPVANIDLCVGAQRKQ